MPDIVGAVFEVGNNPGGNAAMKTWMHEQINNGCQSILATIPFADKSGNYILVLMSTALIYQANPSLNSPVIVSATFDIRNGITSLLDWMNNLQNGVSTPAAPVLSVEPGGSLTDQGTVYVLTIFFNAVGNGLPSPESSIEVPDNYELVVAPPVDSSGLATTYQVLLSSATGEEGYQGNDRIPLGTPFTLFSDIQIGSAPNGADSGMTLLLGAVMSKRGDQQLITVTLYAQSNLVM